MGRLDNGRIYNWLCKVWFCASDMLHDNNGMCNLEDNEMMNYNKAMTLTREERLVYRLRMLQDYLALDKQYSDSRFPISSGSICAGITQMLEEYDHGVSVGSGSARHTRVSRAA